jgi:hypothetical protein
MARRGAKVPRARGAEAIARRNPTLEKLEIARGALQRNLPGETITTLAVTRRLVARSPMFDWPARSPGC